MVLINKLSFSKEPRIWRTWKTGLQKLFAVILGSNLRKHSDKALIFKENLGNFILLPSPDTPYDKHGAAPPMGSAAIA